MASEATPLAAPAAVADPRRWGVLALFCLANSLQVIEWAFYSTIAHAVAPLYGWSTGDFTKLLAWADLAVVVTCPFWPFLVHKIGMRNSLLVAAASLLASNVTRLGATIQGTAGSLGVQFVAAVFNGFAGSPLQFAGPVLAQEWFPPGQRGLATSLCACATLVGAGLNALVHPWAVPDCPGAGCDATTNVEHLLSAHTVLTSLVLLGALCLPERPPLPPSASAARSLRRHQTATADVWAIAHCGPALVIAMLMGVPQALFSCVYADLTPLLRDLNFAEDKAGNLGTVLGFVGAAAAVCAGYVSDAFGGQKLKPLAGALYAVAFASASAFAFFVHKGPAYLHGALLAAACLGPAMAGSIPLFFEMGVEVTYPHSEEAVAAFLVWTIAAWQAVFFAIPEEALDATWMVVALPASLGVMLMCLVPLPIAYKRTLSDKKGEDSSSEADNRGPMGVR